MNDYLLDSFHSIVFIRKSSCDGVRDNVKRILLKSFLHRTSGDHILRVPLSLSCSHLQIKTSTESSK